MRPFAHTLPFPEALNLVMAAAAPILREEVVAAGDAIGRVAALDVRSAVDVPPFDRAAMDGYAVIAADTAGARPDAPARLRRVARLFSGDTPSHAVTAGTCVEIATGAPMPAGADAVVMVEQSTQHEDEIGILAPATAGQNIGRHGADIAVGRVVIRRGDLFSPARVGALAAMGPTTFTCSRGHRWPSCPRATKSWRLASPCDRDRSTTSIRPRWRRWSGSTAATRCRCAPWKTRWTACPRRSTCAIRHDIVVFSGGSSVGDRDLMRDVIAARGEIVFHGIAVRPGKPTLFGRVGPARVFGMPGYPTSCLSNAYMLLVPLLRAMAGLPAWTPQTADLPLASRIASASDRHQFYTVSIANSAAHPAFKASGDITSMANADGYIEIPAGTAAVEKGTVVRVTIF